MLRAADRFLFNLDYILWSVSRSLQLNTDAYCDLETIDGDNAFVTADGSLASLVRIEGVTSMVGSTEFEGLATRLTRCLQSYLGNGHHMMQFVFVRDPGTLATRQLVEDAFSDALATMQRVGLGLHDL